MRYFAAAMYLVAIMTGAVQAQSGFGMAGPKIAYESTLETSGVQPGNAVRGALRFTLSEGWHVNANKPLEEYLIATELKFKDLPGFTLRGVVYPEHKLFNFSFSPEPLAVYEEVFVVGFAFEVDASVAPGVYSLEGTLHYQACNDKMCAPPRDLATAFSVTVAEAAAVETTLPEWFATANWSQLTEPVLAQAVPQEAQPLPEATPSVPEEVQPPPEEAPPVPEETVVAVEPVPALEAEASTAVIEATPSVPQPQAPSETSREWRELAEQFRVAGVLAGFTQKEGFLDFLNESSGVKTAEVPETQRWWWMLLVVLGGGLLLNLTPCVLPLIPINVAIIGAGARAGSRLRGFTLGGAYGLGIALVYGALGLVVVLGLSTAFGTLNATAWFNGLIAALFVILALAMFDVIQIDFSRFQAKLGIQGGGGGHFLVALGMGAVSALLAGACVAPVVIYTILLAQDLYSQGNVFALVLPFGLGLGMALPWPFLGAGLSFLPKPGKWMERVKKAFGLFILGFALYYGHLAYTLAVPPSALPAQDGVWTHSLEEGLSRALTEKRPVIIDFWATWCKNCTVMDKTVLKDEEVLSRLQNHVKIKYQAELLSESPVKDVVEYFNVMGLPTFLVLEPKE